MKNKRGFTLVEILGVVVILGILALLVSAAIMNYFQKGKDVYNENLGKQLAISAKAYYADNREELPTETSDRRYAFVTLPEMENGNYVSKEFTDSEGRECSPSYVFVAKDSESNNYEYIPCLKCQDENGVKDYSNENKYCDPNLWLPNEVDDKEEVTNECDKLDKGYLIDINGECYCPSPKYEDENGNCVSEEISTCPKEGEGGWITKNGECYCPEPYEEQANGECIIVQPNVCAKLDKGYTNGPNGECLCKSPKKEIDGECIIPSSEFTCKGKYDVATKKLTITKATSKYPIYKMYYVTEGSTTQKTLTLTASEKSTGVVTNKEYSNIADGVSVYIEDLYESVSGSCVINDLECAKLDKGYTNGPGGKCECKGTNMIEKNGYCREANAAECTFTKQPSGHIGTSGANFTIKCTNEVEISVKSGYKNLITSANSRGKITGVSYEKSTSGKTITITGKYTPTVTNTENKQDRINVAKGIVGNSNAMSVTNSSFKSSNFYVDTKAPVITYSVTSGSTTSATGGGSGYKSKVTVKVVCKDGGSGVKTFKVAGSTINGTQKTLTKSGRGNYSIASSCKDNASNSASGSKSYRVLEYTCNKSKCGSYANTCKSSCCGCYGHTEYYCPSGYSRAGSVCRKNVRLGPYSSTAICLKSCNYHSITGRCYTTDSGAYVNNGKCPPSHPKCWLCDVYFTTSATSKWVCDSNKTCTSSSCCGTSCKSCWY